MLKYFIGLFLMMIFFSKSYVFYKEKYLSNLKKEAAILKKDIDLLKIEWAYLNQHARLKFLANTFLPDYKYVTFKNMKNLVNKSSFFKNKRK